MSWTIADHSSFWQQTALDLYNSIRARDLPAPAGKYGVNQTVWEGLIDFTIGEVSQRYRLNFARNNLKGCCIYGSVVAAKFLSARLGYKAGVIHVLSPGSDHYFVVAKFGGDVPTVICDITCNQFKRGPNFIVGPLRDIKGVAKKVGEKGAILYDAYELGVKPDTVFI